MDIKEAIRERHSVRYYKDEPISEQHRAELDVLISQCNEESGLSMQLCSWLWMIRNVLTHCWRITECLKT